MNRQKEMEKQEEIRTIIVKQNSAWTACQLTLQINPTTYMSKNKILYKVEWQDEDEE